MQNKCGGQSGAVRAACIILGVGLLVFVLSERTCKGAVLDDVSVEHLYLLRGIEPAQRITYLSKQVPCVAENWLTIWEADVAELLDGRERIEGRNLILVDRVAKGIVLADVLGEPKAEEILEKLMKGRHDIASEVYYGALIARAKRVAKPGFWEKELREASEPWQRRLVVLALGIAGRQEHRAVLKWVEEWWADERLVRIALSELRFQDREDDRVEALSSNEERIKAVERHMRSAFGHGINSASQFWSATGYAQPVSLWAIERWRELGNVEPATMANYINSLNEDHFVVNGPSIEAYRTFPLHTAGPEVKKFATNAK